MKSGNNNKAIKHSIHYFIGNVAGLLIGFASLFILTRMLSVSSYGQLALIVTTLTLLTTLGGFGFPQSAVRFHFEFQKKNALAVFYNTQFWGTCFLGSLVTLLAIGGAIFLPKDFMNEAYVHILRFSLLIILFAIPNELFLGFLRAGHNTVGYNVFFNIRKLFLLGLPIAALILTENNVLFYFLGQFLVEAGLFVFFSFFFKEHIFRGFKHFSRSFFSEALKYGFPHIFVVFSGLVLSLGDRYVIQLFLGEGAVGMYTAGYTLAASILAILIRPMNLAVFPLYTEKWEKEGFDKTKDFLSKISDYYMIIALPLFFGIMSTGKDLISLTITDKYLESFSIFPYVVSGVLFNGYFILLVAGLYIYKKTWIVALITFGAAVFNIFLNILLVPRFGIVGAAQATLVSYCIHCIFIGYFSFKMIKIRLNYSSYAKYILASLIMYAGIESIYVFAGFHDRPIVSLITKVLLGSIIYAAIILIWDHDVRRDVSCQIEKLLILFKRT